MRCRCLTVLAACMAPGAAAAQTQAQQDRINLVAKYVVSTPVCRSLGITLQPELPAKAAAAFEAEMRTWGGDQAQLGARASEAARRAGRVFAADSQAAAQAKTDAELRNLHTFFVPYARTCVAAARDPILAPLMTVPADFDPEAASTTLADSMIEAGGMASWQTPAIRARGDLMMLAGICRAKIGTARSDALVREFGQSDDARTRAYYLQSFDTGLADPTVIQTLAGCNRAIAKTRTEVGR